MYTNKKYKLLKEVLGDHTNTGDELLFYCPYCDHHKRKLSVNLEKGVYKCWVCDSSGRNLLRIIRKFGTYRQVRAWKAIDGRVDLTGFDFLFEEKEKIKQKVVMPKEFITLTGEKHSLSSKRAMSYLENRGITKEDILKWKIGHCVRGEYAGRIIIPSFDITGELNYFVARTYTNNWKRYTNPNASRNIIFNDLYVDWDSDIILVEGAFDAIRAGNAIPLLGSTLREKSLLFQKIVQESPSVYVALDADAEKKAMGIVESLNRYGVEVYKINTEGHEDVAAMSKAVFKEKKNSSGIMNSDNYLLKKIIEA
jgi:DNA primase